jgi:hypothetical protein
MLIALLSLLGIPLWILLGWLAAGLWHRHETTQLPGLFKTKLRVVSGTYRPTGNDFPRMAGNAIWAHDGLIVEKGLSIPRTLHYEITEAVQPTQPGDPELVKGLGDSPITMQFWLEEGTVIEVAARGEDSEFAREPFLTGEL